MEIGTAAPELDRGMEGTAVRRAHRRLGCDLVPGRPDAVVVGAGIVGLAAAFHLAHEGLKVCLLDASQVGDAQSTRNWGFIRQQGRAVEELPIMIEANRMWPQLAAQLGCDLDWVQGGNLRLTDSPERAEDYQRWIDTARTFGLDSRIVLPDEVGRLVPGFAGRYLMAILTPSDGQANPVKVVAGYARALRSMGVTIREYSRAHAIVTAGNRTVGVLTDDGFIGTSNVVLAAGVGSAALLRSVGLEIPVQLVTQTVALTSPVPKVTSACVWTGEIGFRQAPSGEVVLSSGGRGDVRVDLASLASLLSPRGARQALPMYWKNRDYLRIRPRQVLGALRSRRQGDRLEETPLYSDVANSVEAMARYFPDLRLDVATAWAGTIDGTPDALPVIDAVDQAAGLVVATGMSGHGFGIAPAIGRIVADLVIRGSSGHDLSPFRLRRFREGKARAPQHLL